LAAEEGAEEGAAGRGVVVAIQGGEFWWAAPAHVEGTAPQPANGAAAAAGKGVERGKRGEGGEGGEGGTAAGAPAAAAQRPTLRGISLEVVP
jgi:hypothetical protein